MAQCGDQEEAGSMAQNNADNGSEEERLKTCLKSLDDDLDDRKIEIEQKSNVYRDFVLKYFKLLFNAFLVLILIGGVIVSRGGLQILASQLGDHDMRFKHRTVTQDTISYLFFFLIAVPDALKLLQCVAKFAFGNRKKLGYKRLVTVMVRETFHLFGLGCLIFKVMPYTDPLQTCGLTISILFLPSVFDFLSSINRNRKHCHEHIRFISIIFILGSFIATLTTMVLSSEKRNINRYPKQEELIFWSITSIVMMSTRSIKTYHFPKPNANDENQLINETQHDGVNSTENDRPKKKSGSVIMHMISSLLRLILLITLFPTVFCPGIRGFEETLDAFFSLTNVSGFLPLNCTDISKDSNISNRFDNITVFCNEEGVSFWLVISPFLTHCAGTFLTTHFGVLACRLTMQRYGFALPLIVATPLYTIIVIVVNETNPKFANGHMLLRSENKWLFIVFFIIGWIGQSLLCRHVFRDGETRIQLPRRLFVLPHYCSAMVDLALLHSRKKEFKEPEQETTPKTKNNPEEYMVFICATMWHESRKEMEKILKSIKRLQDYHTKLLRENQKKDKFAFEAHIIFDNAIITDGVTKSENGFVEQFREVMEHVFPRKESFRFETPYGKRLCFATGDQYQIVVHLKDPQKIRHKKRWSQIMYMLYIVEYYLPVKCNYDFSSVQEKAEKTFILALDGDVHFEAEALQCLLDGMKINQKVGATCGRIIPGGSGPVVWYQRFEYAIGHWLQKSAEHMFGCVLCSPGCFSLFRVNALLDVMKTYATDANEALEFLQYDQGEDRWLCTLLLQQGHKIEYCAAAEAKTFAPEDFKELFNQRRRWIPSTMANMRYLLWNYKRIIKKNPNMSHLYIFYLTVLFLSSILGPSTVLLALESAITSVFEISHWLAHLVTYGPTVFFIILCLKANSNTQLNFAMVLSAMYALLMMTVFVGTFVSIASEGWYTPSGMFFYILVGTYIIAGLLHPYGLRDLVLGVIYFICIPAGYLLLIIYALCNLENISWGTRENKIADLENNTENQKKEDEKDTGIELEKVTNKVITDTINHVRTYNEKAGSCWGSFCFVFRWINTIIIQKTLHSAQTLLQNVNNKGNNFAAQTNPGTEIIPKSNDDTKTEYKNFEELPLDMLEKIAWEHIISNYLKPEQRNTEDSNKLMEMMTDLRNNVVFGFLFLNALWLTIMTAMNEAKYTINIKIPTTTPIIIEPLGFVFLLVFSLILVLQFIGMVMHRYETMLHILSITRWDSNPQSTPESASNNRNNSNSARRGNQEPLPNVNPRTQAHDNLSFEENVSNKFTG